ncbi:hypothetical protein EVG20_g5107 [Dentipellis fragilis]|uniref:HMG box domain-containing protein n=1 Tax=Dentipellis fragilis TaxID=205917 RepID=A0A4Y9YUA1_9AGAM|nr:hypothetical protein EVG20_g5107 [Dentipellis fragilis]
MLSLLAKRGAIPLRMRTASARTFTFSSTRQLAARKSKSESASGAAKKKPASTTKPKKEKKEKKPAPLKVSRDQMPPPQGRSNAYAIFVREHAPKIPVPSKGDGTPSRFKQVADMWQVLPESEKDVYRRRFVEENKVVREQYDAWLKTVDPELLKAINAKRTKRGQVKIRKQGSIRRPGNSYTLFVKDVRDEYPREAQPADSTDKYFIWLMKQIGERWKALSDEERAPYREKFEQIRDAYYTAKQAE